MINSVYTQCATTTVTGDCDEEYIKLKLGLGNVRCIICKPSLINNEATEFTTL